MNNIEVRFLNLEYFFNLIYEFLTGGIFTDSLPATLSSALFWIKLISLIITPFLFAGVVVLAVKLARIRAQEMADMRTSLFGRLQTVPAKNERWEKVLYYVSTENPAEWKLAIIEADNMLDDLVKRLATSGDNLGERLKSINPGDFLTLDDAWEAHKVRNRIAHEAGYEITKHTAREVVERYKRAFEEFDFI